ncbi:MAG: MBL fold metallo-hydrolase [Prevotella sp.]|nr:MBL fold metallo-hydrolase [Prevotella sp.]
MLQENCYVVSDESRECVIIDCGAFFPEEKKEILQYIRDNNLIPKHLLATHGHLDHNFGNQFILDEFGLKVEIHRDDADFITNYEFQAEKFFGMTAVESLPEPARLLTGDDIIEFGNHRLTIIETPGHSRGSIFFYCKEENVCCSGDSLFEGTIGRTDLMGGSMFMLIQSLRTIVQLPDETVVWPGHGQQTTIVKEVATNMYLER